MVGVESLREESHYVALLLLAGGQNGEDGFNESTSRGTLGAEAEFTPDDGMT